jgi:hypothetical protein
MYSPGGREIGSTLVSYVTEISFFEAFINILETRKKEIYLYLQIFSTGSHAVTQLQHQSLVRISAPGCPKSRQSLVCITFSFNKNHYSSTTEDCSVS